VRTVLHRGVDARRETGPDGPTGNGTLFDLGLVLGDLELEGRQVEHLAAFVVEHRLAAQTDPAALAAGTAVQAMHVDMVGFGDRLQGRAGVARLASGFAPARGAQAAGRGFGQAVGGGRFVAVTAGLGQAVIQIGHLLFEVQTMFDQHLGLGARLLEEFLTAGHGASKRGRHWARRG